MTEFVPANSDLPEAPRRWYCEDCGQTCSDSELLVADHPFEPGDKIHGCPHCHETDLIAACYVDGCNKPASAGTPRFNGFRYTWTCFEHGPHGAAKANAKS